MRRSLIGFALSMGLLAGASPAGAFDLDTRSLVQALVEPACEEVVERVDLDTSDEQEGNSRGGKLGRFIEREGKKLARKELLKRCPGAEGSGEEEEG